MNNKELASIYHVNRTYNFELVEPESVTEELVFATEVEELPGVRVFRPHTRKPVQGSEQLKELYRKIVINQPLRKPNPGYNRMPGEKPTGLPGISVPFRGTRKTTMISEEFPIDDYEPAGQKPGWLLYNLNFLETCINGRWLFWEESKNNKHPVKDAWVQLDFRSQHTTVFKMLYNCIEQIEPNFMHSESKWGAIHYFFDWLLWSLGHPSVTLFPETKDYLKGEITEFRRTAHNRLMPTIDLRAILLYPHDYFGSLLEEFSDEEESYEFSIKIDQAQRWCEKHFKSQGSKSIHSEELFIDPNVESGRMLLAASNYSTHTIGFSSDTWAAKAALINLYFYAPHLLYCKDYYKENQPNYSRALTIADWVAEFKGCSEYKDNFTFTDDGDQNLTPIILIEEKVNALPPADEFSQFMNAVGGSESSNALPPADEFSQFMNAVGGSESSNALPPADEFSQFMNAVGGSESNNALPPADEFSQFMNAVGGSESNNALPPADEFSQFMNAVEREKEPEILPTRKLLGGSDD